MAKLDDFLATNPEAKAEYDRAMKAQADAASAAALEAEKGKKPAAATRAELKGIVPAGMADREALIGELQDQNATVAQAHTAVATKLAAQNAELAAKLAQKGTTETVLPGATGGPALRLANTGGAGDKNATYDSAVEAEQDRLIGKGMEPREALGRARMAVSRTRPDLLKVKNKELKEEARSRTG